MTELILIDLKERGHAQNSYIISMMSRLYLWRCWEQALANARKIIMLKIGEKGFATQSLRKKILTLSSKKFNELLKNRQKNFRPLERKL